LCGRPKSSSPGEKLLPRAGFAPITRKKFAVTIALRTCSGSSQPVSTRSAPLYAANASMVLLCARQSSSLGYDVMS
jgi:hypothetical protein